MSFFDNPGMLAPARVTRIDLPKGGFILACSDALGEVTRCIGDWLEYWAARTPNAPFLAERHPAGAAGADIAWLPGPQDAGWVDFIDRGFRDAIADSAVRIVDDSVFGLQAGLSNFIPYLGALLTVAVLSVAAITVFDPATGTLRTRRWLLDADTMAKARALVQDKPALKGCGSDSGARAAIARLESDLMPLLPGAPNERIVYRCQKGRLTPAEAAE